MPVDEQTRGGAALFDDGKDADALRTIGEVSEALGIKRHVLRYWEQQFSTLRPLKRSGGRRYYRREDIVVIQQIDHLVNDQGFTLKGARKALKNGAFKDSKMPDAATTSALAEGDAALFRFSGDTEKLAASPDHHALNGAAHNGTSAKGAATAGTATERHSAKDSASNASSSGDELITRLKGMRDRLSNALDN